MIRDKSKSNGRIKYALVILSVLISGCAMNTAQRATDMSESTAKLPELKNPRIVLRKSARKLDVFDGEKLIKTYSTVLGFSPTGDKEIEGDGKTPEGEFYIFTKNPNSRFHLSLGVSYPGKEDAARGLKEKLISQKEHDEIVKAIDSKQTPPQKTKLGGEIYIHGGGMSSDWTDGCIALENNEMTELFDGLPVGTKVVILP